MEPKWFPFLRRQGPATGETPGARRTRFSLSRAGLTRAIVVNPGGGRLRRLGWTSEPGATNFRRPARDHARQTTCAIWVSASRSARTVDSEQPSKIWPPLQRRRPFFGSVLVVAFFFFSTGLRHGELPVSACCSSKVVTLAAHERPSCDNVTYQEVRPAGDRPLANVTSFVSQPNAAEETPEQPNNTTVKKHNTGFPPDEGRTGRRATSKRGIILPSVVEAGRRARRKVCNVDRRRPPPRHDVLKRPSRPWRDSVAESVGPTPGRWQRTGSGRAQS